MAAISSSSAAATLGILARQSFRSIDGARFGKAPVPAAFAGIARRSDFSRRSTRRRSDLLIARCESGAAEDKPAFGYTRKDVVLIGVGITIFGFGLKSALEFFGVDSLKAGNVVQLVLVLGLTVAWTLSYVLRVSNKDMTYAKQLKDYELKVMEKRYQEMPEAELEAFLAQVEEEKERSRNKGNNTA